MQVFQGNTGTTSEKRSASYLAGHATGSLKLLADYGTKRILGRVSGRLNGSELGRKRV